MRCLLGELYYIQYSVTIFKEELTNMKQVHLRLVILNIYPYDPKSF